MIKAAKRLDQVKTYYFATKLKEIAALQASGQDIINLGIGSPDLAAAPSVKEKLSQSLDVFKADQYQSYYGLPELKEGFAAFYKRYYNVTLDTSSEILPLIGSKEGIMHIAMSFLDAGDEVLVPNPGYPAYKMTTLLAGGNPKFYDLTDASGWEPDFKKIEENDLTKVKLMWVNYPHMPTGKKPSEGLFDKLVKFGKKHNILICHDNPYAFILNDKPQSILSAEGSKDVAIELFSMSKGHNMAGWRLGAVCGHPEYIASIVKFKSNMDSGMYKPVQLAGAEALSLGQDWFDNLNATYKTRRQKVWQIFDVLGFSYDKDAAGLFVWAEVTSDNGEIWSDLLLAETEVFITPGFIFGDNGTQYVRASLCCDKITLYKALERIKKRFG